MASHQQNNDCFYNFEHIELFGIANYIQLHHTDYAIQKHTYKHLYGFISKHQEARPSI